MHYASSIMHYPSAFTSIPSMSLSPLPYIPPDFAHRISRYAPSHKINLAMRPTPIQPWHLHSVDPNLPPNITFSIKRDDMTGCVSSGNKIRKLEFLLADALNSQCTSVITAGGIQSNHARATVDAAKQLGLKPYLFLRSKHANDPVNIPSHGNVLLEKMLAAEVFLVKPMPYLTGLLPKMEKLAEKISKEDGEKAYIIGIGGSNAVGVWGYIDAFNEMIGQGVCEEFSDVVVAVGSGGTASGLAIGNYLSGSRVRIHAVTVCDDDNYFYAHLDEMLVELGLDSETSARQILNIVEAKGLGYSKNTVDELELCVKVSERTGIILDPTYTLKGLYGLLNELKGNDASFAGDARILFVHTGGIFSLFDRRIEPHLDHSKTKTWISQ